MPNPSPAVPAPSPELIAKNPKTKVNGVYALGPEHKLYFIPTAELARFEVPPESAKHDPVPEPESEDEVSGRHPVWLRNGTFGFHSDWLVGPYIWWRDGGTYYGLHRHAWGTSNPLAVDTDD